MIVAHAVVHWNLPANPVDLEQREGRAHRYKDHAVRRKIAATHGRAALVDGLDPENDPWDVLFEMGPERTERLGAARRLRVDGVSGRGCLARELALAQGKRSLRR